ncbi:unnamed protein product [Linum trigynum]|uniref:Uncharacterized protein n=1 Tax=Linum trigynum TaxID=586398 RepID=A0AAV2ELX7_9ROSI
MLRAEEAGDDEAPRLGQGKQKNPDPPIKELNPTSSKARHCNPSSVGHLDAEQPPGKNEGENQRIDSPHKLLNQPS